MEWSEAGVKEGRVGSLFLTALLLLLLILFWNRLGKMGIRACIYVCCIVLYRDIHMNAKEDFTPKARLSCG